MTSPSGSTIDESQAFLDAHPEIEAFDIVLTDANGVGRGKIIRRHELEGLYKHGRHLPISILGLDITGEDVHETGLIWDSGDGDLRAWPIPGTLVPLHGTSPARGQYPLSSPLLFAPAACSSIAPFNDVPTSHPYCAWIQQLKNDQISAGCGGGRFCPDEPVTRQQLAMMLEKVMRGTGAWDPWRGMFVRTRIVNPVVGDDEASGLRLLQVLASITDSSSDNPYLVLVEPGRFDVENQQVELPPYVTLRGSGPERTNVAGHVSGGTIECAEGSVIEALKVINQNPAATQAVGIDVPSDANATIRQVVAIADHLAEKLKAAGFGSVPIEGRQGGDWVLVDAGDVVVHVFRPEIREFYNIEKMWQAPDLEDETVH